MRYELIPGDITLLNLFIRDGWTLIDTFSNPNPQPYFFALILLNKSSGDDYDVSATYEKARILSLKQETEK